MHDQSQGELYPLNLEYALLVCRFGNAESSARGDFSFRYQLDVHIHEPFDKERDLIVWDEVGVTWCTVTDVYESLSPSNRYWVDYQYRALISRQNLLMKRHSNSQE
jgi:hypothetical protein